MYISIFVDTDLLTCIVVRSKILKIAWNINWPTFEKQNGNFDLARFSYLLNLLDKSLLGTLKTEIFNANRLQLLIISTKYLKLSKGLDKPA